MTVSSPLLRTGQLINQARGTHDRFPDGQVPAEQARQVAHLLDEAEQLQRQHEAEERLTKAEDFLREPQYRHDMSVADDDRQGGLKSYVGGGGSGGSSGGLSTETKAFLAYLAKGDRSSPEVKAAIVEGF